MGNRWSRQRPQGGVDEQNAVNSNSTMQQGGGNLPQDSHYARYPAPVPGQQQQYQRPHGRYYYGGGYPPGNAQYGSNSYGPPQQQPYGRQPQQQPQHAAGGRSRRPETTARPQSLTQTATIRNSVNLKKNSLRLESFEGNESVMKIVFDFDASAPCCVMTCVGGKEEGTAMVPIKSIYQDAQAAELPLAIKYEKGLGQIFPRDDMTLHEASQHVVDLHSMDKDCLLGLKGGEDGYGLIVRLATVTEKGLQEGHTLDEISPNLPLAPWIQSQTTFASLELEDGTWKAKVLKQKLWVDGVSYELQEIYGLENAAAGPQGSSSEEHLCVICLVNRRDTTALPCRHMCMCHECADELRKQSSVCPICRNNVDSLLRIKLNHGNAGNQEQ